jgi:uncharacterized RDD family membrane protein YckC
MQPLRYGRCARSGTGTRAVARLGAGLAIGAYLLRLPYASAAVLYLAIGAVLLVVVGRSARRLDLLAWTGVVTVVGLIVYGPLLEAIMGTTVGA